MPTNPGQTTIPIAKEQAMANNLFEGLERDDLKNLVHSELHVDEFKSKLGEDSDVIVLSFKVNDKEPANDLAAFLEKGYDCVIDADVSSGEMDDGSYIVFVEIDRKESAANDIMDFMSDLMNLTGQDLGDWRVRYFKSRQERKLSLESLRELIPLTPSEYNSRFNKDEIDKLKAVSGIKVDTKAPTNELTEKLRDLAGILR
jgi:hypothetical protein